MKPPAVSPDRQPIDRDIFARRIMAAIAKTQTAHGCGFRDALHLVRARYDQLRVIAPERLAPPAEYWGVLR